MNAQDDSGPSADPADPSRERSRSQIQAIPGEGAAAGDLLISELDCCACHSADEAGSSRFPVQPAPRLDRVGARITPEYLRRFLLDPATTRHGTTMPALLSGLDPSDREAAVEALVHFLVSLGGPMPLVEVELEDSKLEEGRHLYHRIGCVACHDPQEPAARFRLEAQALLGGTTDPSWTEAALPGGVRQSSLQHLITKTTVPALSAFLLDPLSVRPSGRMPSLHLTSAEAEAIACYLLRDQAIDRSAQPPRPRRGIAPGLRYSYLEGAFGGKSIDLPDRKQLRTGVVPSVSLSMEHAPDHFGLVFDGSLRVELAGKYELETTSDDGSCLFVNGALVVDNDGYHSSKSERGSVVLSEGDHALRVTYAERDGGEELTLKWKGPGFDWQEIPPTALHHEAVVMRPESEEFIVNAELSRRGQEWFSKLGCASCHEVDTSQGRVDSRVKAKALSAVARLIDDGCISESPRPGLPSYLLSPSERDSMRASLRSLAERSPGLSRPELLRRTLGALSCLKCHTRDGEGGPAAERAAYFDTSVLADIGDEGRLPPTLSGVGAKLRRDSLADVLHHHGTARPYMATRMPQFGESGSNLPELFAEVDGTTRASEPPFSEERVDAGRLLIGKKGFGCVQCHRFAGHESLGMPALDLAGLYRRLTYSWFREFLLHPTELKPGTRMPTYAPEGRSTLPDLLQGDFGAQIDAMWSYLSLGMSAPLPAGIEVVPGEYDVLVKDEPAYCAVFMKDLSPRVLLVGFPERIHVAFDFENLRLAKAWRGDFFKAKGTWHGRAGELQVPPGEKILDFCAGNSFAVLASVDQPWPQVVGRAAGFRKRGHRIDADHRPVFEYRMNAIEIAEKVVPVLAKGGARLQRRIWLSSPEKVEGVFMRAAVGDVIEEEPPGEYVIDHRSRAFVDPGFRPIARSREGREELLIPVAWRQASTGFHALLELTIAW